MLQKKQELFSNLLVLTLTPVILTVLFGVLISIICNGLIENRNLVDLIVIWVSMIMGMCVMPLVYLRRTNGKFSMEELGIRRLSNIDVVLLALVILFLVSGVFFIPNVQVYDFFQNVSIAFAEEFWCKAILFYQLRKITNKKYIIIILSAIIFAFVTHMNGNIETNLLLRMPMGIITGVIYEKDRNLVLPFLLHLVYNIVIV